jgi:hypothetical protein
MRLLGHVASDKRGIHSWFSLEIHEERDHSEDLDVDGLIALYGSYRERMESVEWIHLVQDRDQWQAVNMVMKMRVA